MPREINKAGLALIQRFEGLRLEAYQDSVGVWTIGYGHTKNVGPGDTLTEDEADDRLLDDLQTAEECVESAVPGLTDNQFAACVALAFNIGCSAFKNSTLVKLCWAKDFLGAASQFSRWDMAGGRHVPGLANRRRAEAALFSEA